jgi:hypothetical protein
VKTIVTSIIIALVACNLSGCFGIGHPKRRPTTYDMRRTDLDQVESQSVKPVEYRIPQQQ